MAVGYAVVQLVAVAPGMGLGWDEVVYVSQVDPRVPAAEFIAPRARGITLLVAPVVLVTSSTEALRVYLCVLSALGLYASFGVWLRVRPGPVVPVAALLFASTWLALFYGNEAMPNLWVAFGAVAATGFFLRCVRPGAGLGPATGLALSVAAVALLRPPDSVWLVLPLALALAWPGWRCRRAGAALVAGLAVGWADWIVEAYVRFGGLAARWHAAGAANETGLHVSLLDHVRALDGPLLCRPPADCGPVVTPWLVWLIAVPVLALLGLYAARRHDRSPAAPRVPGGVPSLPGFVLAVGCGLAMAVPYAFLVGYAAPRFLLPAYALLALPVAHAVWSPGRRPALAGLVAAGVVAQVVLQGITLDKVVTGGLARRGDDVRVARALLAMDVRPPCLVYGEHAVMIAYRMGCHGYPVLSWPQEAPAQVRGAPGTGTRVVVVDRGGPTPAPFLRPWEAAGMPGRWHAYQLR
ncbi:hypothetical protein GCM10009733_034130 [Nonomuraea maheshkhaliensis]|uniref:Glycosyltransferase RgtA/B/C/D-like domain-containing protein n=1 Tax=Nonomuraea maheshkhaliensis TaxID=419590 RepID=A0ABP4R3R0_9ACTN